MSVIKKISLLLAAVICGMILGFWALDMSESFEPKYLLAVLNTVFIGAANLLVFFLCARTYLKTGFISAGLMAAATLIMGLGSIFSGWMRYIAGGMNIYSTVFNINALVASVLHLTAAFREHRDRASGAPAKYAPVKMAVLIAGCCGFTVFITVGAVYGFLPPFFEGGGYTSLRTATIFVASAIHLSAAVALVKSYQRNKQNHLFWYSLSMLMFSFGLLGTGMETMAGGLVEWAGRLAKYTSGIFAYFSATEILKAARRKGMGVSGVMSRFFAEAPPIYQNVLETCRYAIVSVDQDFCIVYFNPDAEALFAVSREQVLGTSFDPFVSDKDSRRLQDDMSCFAGGGVSELSDGLTEIMARNSVGREFPAEVSVSVYTAEAGCVCTYFIRDITRRIEAQAMMDQQTSVLLAINRIYDTAVFCETSEELAKTCLAVVEEVTESKASFMAEISENGTLHETAFSASTEMLTNMEKRSSHNFESGEFRLHGLYGAVVHSGRTLLTNDPAAHPEYFGVPAGHMPLTAFLGVPIFNEGQPVGLIAVANRENGYRKQDQEMIEALAPTILEVFMRKKAEISARHIAFERTVLLLSQEFINTPLDRLDSAVNSAMEHIAEYCGADRSSIYLYDWGGKVIRRLYGWDSVEHRPAGEKSSVIPFANIPEIIEHHLRGETHFVNCVDDVPAHSPYRKTMLARNTCATANFPFAANGAVTGMLSLSTEKKPMSWNDAKITAVQIFCQMIISVLARIEEEQAIREAREREEQHIDFERTMLLLAQSFINTPVGKYKDSIIKALGIIGSKTEADRVTIYRFDWEAGVARHMYEWDRLPEYYAGDKLAAISIGNLTSVIESIEKGQAYIQRNSDPQHIETSFDVITHISGCVSGIVFPLYRNGSLYGTLGLSAHSDKIPCAVDGMLVRIFSEMVSNMLERIDATLALQEANETNRMILDSTYDGVAMFDRHGIVLSAGRVFAAQFDRTPEEMVGIRMSDYTLPDQLKSFVKNRYERVQRVLQTGIAELYEDNRDGIWLDTRICPVFKDGQIVAATLFSTDISDRKKAEEEAALIAELEMQAGLMQQRENDYLEMLDGSTDGSWIYDIQKGTIHYSEQWIKLIGMEHVPPEKRLAYATEILLHPDDREAVAAAQRTAFENRVPKYKLEYRLKTADGHYMWVLGQSKIVYNEDGLPLKIYGTSMDITDRKQTENALGENELLLRTFMDSASDFMFIKDRDGRVVMVNAAYGRIFGVDIKDVVGKNDYELYPDPDMAREVIENDRLVMETGRMLICQESAMTKNGYRTFSLSKVPWRDTHGIIQGVLGTAHDITELKNARDELQEMVKSLKRSNECIELLYETTERILSSAAPRGEIEELCTKVMDFLDCGVFFNYLMEDGKPMLKLNACGGVSEAQRQEMEYLPIGTAVCGRVALTTARVVAEHIQSAEQADTTFFREMGIRAFACHPLVADGKAIGTLGFGTRTRARFSDEELALMKTVADSIAVAIKRKRAEEALQRSETLLRAIINGANDPVFLKDRQCRTLMANAATAEASGISLDDILGKVVLVYHKDLECARAIMENDKRVMENDRAEVIEERVYSGTVMRTFLSSKTPWHDAQGNVIGLIGVARDITDRIEMEQELRQTAHELSEKNALVTDFFINISHEFKTPISVLQLAMEILSEHRIRGSLNDDLLERNLGIMLQNTCRLSKLVGNLLDVTKIDAGFLQPMLAYTDIVSLLKNLVESVRPYANKRGLHLMYLSGFRNKVMLTDTEFVERIVINLLSNAIKHTPKGGTVNVTLEDRGDKMLITVRDNGEGIPYDKKNIIFDRYRQVNNTLARSNEGCGIGLSLCKSLTELLDGRIWVESMPGRGSDFFVELPLKQSDDTVKNIGVQSSNLQSRVMMEFSDISF